MQDIKIGNGSCRYTLTSYLSLSAFQITSDERFTQQLQDQLQALRQEVKYKCRLTAGFELTHAHKHQCMQDCFCACSILFLHAQYAPKYFSYHVLIWLIYSISSRKLRNTCMWPNPTKPGTSGKTCVWVYGHKRWLVQNYFQIFTFAFSCLLSGK